MKTRRNKHRNIHKKLVDECRKGNRKAQTEIYRLYYKAMFNTCLRIVGRSEDAEDIMQESFLKAFKNLEQYKGEVSFGVWLKKIVINRSLDHLRKNKNLFENISEKDLVEEEEQSTFEVEDHIDIRQIKTEIDNLPSGYRVVLSLYLLEGYDHDEIAQILRITASTSRSQYARAKKKLAENLKKKYNERS